MLSLEQIQLLKATLLSDRLRVGGHEIVVITGLIQALDNEEKLLLANQVRTRLRPVPGPGIPTVQVPPEPGTSPGTGSASQNNE